MLPLNDLVPVDVSDHVHGPQTSARRRMLIATAGLLWAGAFVLSLSTFVVFNDHFDRISRARQIVRYGELPFRDFFDPGYFATLFSSAASQVLVGDSLLGELLLNAAFIATGTILVLLLSLRISGSLPAAIIAAVMAFVSMPRPYDYDKFLFYPLGIVLCWRYIERSTLRNAVMLGVGVVAAALFRYDTGVYIGCAAIVAIAAIHASDWKTLARRLGQFAAAIAVAALPVLVFLEFTGGIVNAIDQVVTYAARERARTHISTWPPVSFGQELLVVDPPTPPANEVLIRWSPLIDDTARDDLASRHALHGGALRGPAENRTWAYRIADPSTENIRALIADPRVEDTHGIDRGRAALTPEPLWTRLRRAVPLLRTRILPGSWHADNAAAFLYYLLVALPILAAIALLVTSRSNASNARREIACILSLVTMCVALDVFILRAPIEARVGGMAGPAAVLAAWIAARARRTHGTISTAAIVVVLALTVWSTSVAADWSRTLWRGIATLPRLPQTLQTVSQSPPNLDTMQNGRLVGLVTYLRECTRPDDRVFVPSFLPELYFFAQRGFAGGMIVTFGRHWSERRFETRIVGALASQSVPIAIMSRGQYENLGKEYPLVARYMREHYLIAGESDFGFPDAGAEPYGVLVRNNSAPVRAHPASSMPCFR